MNPIGRDMHYNLSKKRPRSQLSASSNPLANLSKYTKTAIPEALPLLQPAVFSLNSPSTSRIVNKSDHIEHLSEAPSKRTCTSSLTSSDKEDHAAGKFKPF